MDFIDWKIKDWKLQKMGAHWNVVCVNIPAGRLNPALSDLRHVMAKYLSSPRLWIGQVFSFCFLLWCCGGGGSEGPRTALPCCLYRPLFLISVSLCLSVCGNQLRSSCLRQMTEFVQMQPPPSPSTLPPLGVCLFSLLTHFDSRATLNFATVPGGGMGRKCWSFPQLFFQELLIGRFAGMRLFFSLQVEIWNLCDGNCARLGKKAGSDANARAAAACFYWAPPTPVFYLRCGLFRPFKVFMVCQATLNNASHQTKPLEFVAVIDDVISCLVVTRIDFSCSHFLERKTNGKMPPDQKMSHLWPFLPQLSVFFLMEIGF